MTIKLAGVREAITNSAVSGATPAAATETVLAGSQIVLPNGLKVGAKFKWRVSMTKTAAGTGNSSFKVKTNTTATVATGTTAGAATALTLTFPTAETAAAGSAIVDIEAIVQEVDAAAGIVFGQLQATSTATAATGFSNQQVAAVGTAIDTSGDVESVGLTITTGAADVVTVNYVEAEATGL
jgi:hypothetical protein